jgi:hypothetical protein
MYDLPSYVWALVLTGVIGIPATTVVMLYRGAGPARLGRRTATGVAVVAAYVLGGWIVASGLLARAGVYHQDSGEAAPWFGVAFAGTPHRAAVALQQWGVPPMPRSARRGGVL